MFVSSGMLRLEAHDDVTRLQLSSAASRIAGYAVSAYAVPLDDGRRVLVDTGFPGVRRALVAWVTAERRAGRPIVGAIVTHRHEDHAGNVEALARLGLPLLMGEATRRSVEAVGAIGLYRHVTWGQMPSLRTRVPTLDAAPLVLVPTPGHSSDHHAVWDPRTRTLFGGDLFLGVKVRIAHPGEDPRALARSLRAAAALAPVRLFDAHRGLVRDPVPLLLAKAAWIDETVGAIERLLAAGWPERRIRQRVLGREGLAGYVSRGDYSRLNFVRAVRRGG